MKIYFVRHYKTLGNLQKKYIGSSDEDLFEPEKQQLISLPKIKTYSSPMLRCKQSCELLHLNEYTVIKDLRETNFGEFEGKTYEDLKDNLHYRNYIDGKEELILGENKNDFKNRCLNAFFEITCNHQKNDTIIIVCHGGTIMAIMEKLEKNQLGFYGYQIKNGTAYLCNFENEEIEILEEIT